MTAPRLVRHAALHPWLAMALDQAVEPEPLILRFYRWEPAGLSLGYFQRAADFPEEMLRRHGWVLVRRVTGGAAICHAGDLTFSIVCRPEHPWFAGTVEQSYDRVHAAIARGLERLGVAAAPRGATSARSDSAQRGEPVCFHAATRFDLVALGRKLVGSAQRRTRDRLLHHGSIPLAPNPLAREAACLEGVMHRQIGAAEVEAALVAGFEQEMGATFRESEISAAEQARAEDLVRRQFGTEEWNRGR